jgi:hypothetical protein
VTLLLLTIPHQVITWILRKEYINGEVFTMGGNSMRLEKIERLQFGHDDAGESDTQNGKSDKKTGKIIAFKKKD